MATLVYAPELRIRVATRDHGTLDISDDVVAASLNIRTNGLHTLSLQLQNAVRKYDGKIRPMDRVVVEMKRIVWVRTFSGYFNNGPVFSVWPRVLNLTASCTLKRLQFWYWDSTTSAVTTLVQETMLGNGEYTIDPNPETTGGDAGPSGMLRNVPTGPGAGGITGQDVKVRETAVRVLTEVVGWPQERIHIAEVPGEWYTMAESIYQSVVNNIEIPESLIGDFTSGGTVGGQAMSGSTGGAGGLLGNGTLAPGNYGGTNYSAEQAANASIIYNVAAGRGLPARAAVIAIATAWQEASMRNISHGDRDSLGLFQQRPSMGWGTPQQVTDPIYASGKFYDALVKVNGWETMPLTVAAQRVQRSGHENAYAKWEGTAQAAVDVLSRTAAANTPGGATSPPRAGPGGTVLGSDAPTGVGTASGGPSTAGTAPVGSGRNVALVATNLIRRNPPGHIRYQLGNDDPYNAPDPRVLDCSSLVDWVYYHAVGRPWITPRGTVATQKPKSTLVPVALGMQIKGALLFRVGGDMNHVEISLGNGSTVGAHSARLPLAEQVDIGPTNAGAWTHAGLMPGVDYRDAATTQQAAAELSRIINQPTTVTDPNETGTGTMAGGTAGVGGAVAQGPDGNAAFNAFVNVYAWGLRPSVTGDLLPGARALMNDQPMLPWISNLMATIMRSWCSAPNGDFMAWFPDYFGLWDSAARMYVQSIELMDFTVEWYDQEIVTHQFVIGAPRAFFDVASATVAKDSIGGEEAGGGLSWMLMTEGVVTMDFPEIFKGIFGIAASEQFVNEYLDRFGARPNIVNMPVIRWKSGAEFFMALYLFLQRWANQFRANIPLTFMPELWPGMILVLPEYDFQAYVQEVNHQIQFGPGGGFKTSVKVVAPARTSAKTDIFGLLPLGGAGG